MTLDNGLVRVDADFTNNGTIRGSGAVDLPSGQTLVNNGTIEPGNAIGILRVTGGGDVLMRDPGSIIIDIAGLMPGTQYDQFNINGQLRFDSGAAGRLEVVLDPDYTPVVGDTFEILHYSSFDGWFNQLVISDIFLQIRENDRFILQVVPTPGSAMALSLGGLLAARRRRR
jgi:hypothetical protein